MLSTLVVVTPEFSTIFLFNLVCTLVVIAFCLFRFIKKDWALARLSFVFAAFACLFYQIPLVLFSAQLKVSLHQPWNYALAVNGGVLTLALWNVLTRHFDLHKNIPVVLQTSYGIYILTGVMGVGLLWIYFLRIPYYCTGLYALLFDPVLTSLARELSGKLIGTSWATLSLGAYANAIAPIFILFSIWLIRDSFLSSRPLHALVGGLGGFFSIMALLITGTKGLLIPTIVMLTVGAYFGCKTWFSKIFTFSCFVAFLIFCLASFEIFRGKKSETVGTYDFAACSVEIGSCDKSHELLESLKARELSLNIPMIFVDHLQSRLACLCEGDGHAEICPTATLLLNMNDIDNRFIEMLKGISYRTFVAPFQVSAWHFMYSETESFDRLKTLPFSKKIFGDSISTPELVYQKYASIYFRGNKTSTGSAPTSFFLAYSANLSWVGFFLALGCIIGLDIFLIRFAMFVDSSLIIPLIGLVVIISLKFISSDFVTVLLSHGGIASIFTIYILTIFLRKKT